jgi:hypothetical protein
VDIWTDDDERELSKTTHQIRKLDEDIRNLEDILRSKKEARQAFADHASDLRNKRDGTAPYDPNQE